MGCLHPYYEARAVSVEDAFNRTIYCARARRETTVAGLETEIEFRLN
ncbi:MAG: hypothetical protein GY906_03275 [bacterium]|nr:hypothetical protein [bacterium]